jgi:N-acetylmuramoyl-L-alanine amidase
VPVHNVTQGECISSIADQAGFFWETLWNHPNNARLKQLRKNPNALLPGDSVFIPDKRKKEESCGPTRRHTFRLKGVPVRFNVRLLDSQGNPRAGIPFSLVIDGKTTEGTVPDDGNLSEIIKPNAKKAKLTLSPPNMGPEEYEFQLGHMNPVDDAAGTQGRLKNLGYYNGAIDGSADEATVEAIRRFQEDAGLAVTGQADAATQAALTARHGG